MLRIRILHLIKGLMSIAVAMLLIFNSGGAISQEDCGECDNPLVQVMDCGIDGDVPESTEWFGWEDAKKGDVTLPEQMDRAFEILFQFLKKNPCADIYYILDPLYKDPVRIGAKKGNKKYEIRSEATIKNAGEGDQALVWEQTNGNETLKLVPLKAQVLVFHKLVALKNAETYDKGTDLLDWVKEPPSEDSTYFFAHDDELEVDGLTWIGNDGLISGSVPPSALASISIHMDKGDIGVTIRKKETPMNMSLDANDLSEFPPYYKLKIANIKNQFNETMPDNVKIALKVQKGELEGGEMLDGWNVFTTTGGKINDEVKYRPPQCSDAKEDILEVAGICDYHDGPESVGEKEFTKKIPNTQCFDATLTITGDLMIRKKESHNDESWDTYKENRSYSETIHASVVFSLTMINSADMYIFGEYWEYYQPKARSLSFFSTSMTDKRYEMGFNSETGIGFDTTVTITGFGNRPEFISPMMANTIIIAYDKKTKKPKRIVTAGADIEYKINITDRLNSTIYNRDSGDQKINETKSKVSDKTFKLGTVNEGVKGPAGNIYPELLVSSGDGLKAFGGYAKVMKDTSGDDCYWYDTCHEERSFRWSFKKMKSKK